MVSYSNFIHNLECFVEYVNFHLDKIKQQMMCPVKSHIIVMKSFCKDIFLVIKILKNYFFI